MKPNTTTLFTWFGSKRRAASRIWQELGNPKIYAEPFAGSAAVLLGRPKPPIIDHAEIINDADGYLVNFWRAMQQAPEQIAQTARSFMLAEAELLAAKRFLAEHKADLLEKLKADPTFADPYLAGLWCFRVNSSNRLCPNESNVKNILLSEGKGLTRYTMTDREAIDLCLATRDRVRHISALFGDWQRCADKAITWVGRHRLKPSERAIFLDPPYKQQSRSKLGLYRIDAKVNRCLASEAYDWAIANAENAKIVYAMGVNDFPTPPNWTKFKLGSNNGRFYDEFLCNPVCQFDQTSLLTH